MGKHIRGIGFVLALAVFTGVLAGLARTTAYSADGDLDPTFSGDGLVTTNFHNTSDEAHAVVIQPDDKIVVVGTTNISGNNNNFSVARYNPDGSPDTTFGFGDGEITTDFTSSRNDSANAVVIQPDGKIVVGGTSCTPDFNFCNFAIARYLPDGNLDGSFDVDGLTQFYIEHTINVAFGVALQDDDKIVMAGYTSGPEFPADFALGRLNTDGTLDTNFDGDGRLYTNFFDGVDEARGIAIQPDGKIVAAGNAQVSGLNYDFAVTRYLPNGDLDTGFDGDGKVTTDFFGGDDGAYAVALHPDGYIYAAGGFYSTGQGYDFGLARYFPDGGLDTSFDVDGVLGINFAAGTATEVALGVMVQPSDGKVVAVGYAPVQGVNDFALVRLLADGSLDTSFGDGGKVMHNFGAGEARAHGVAIQPDGKIVAAGGSYTSDTANYDYAVARYMLGDPPEPSATPTDSPTPTASPTPTSTPASTPPSFYEYLPLMLR